MFYRDGQMKNVVTRYSLLSCDRSRTTTWEVKTMSDENVGMSGLTASEASEFMRSYEKGMWTFVFIASAAHIAVWKWQPWFGM